MGADAPAHLIPEFQSRGLSIQAALPQILSPTFAASKALVLWEPNDAVLQAFLGKQFEAALSHGLVIRIVAPLGRTTEIGKALENVPYRAALQVVATQTASGLPELFARHNPGPSANLALQIGGMPTGSAEDEVLVRRAFTDCQKLVLRPMETGTARVFQAFATLSDSRAGPFPLPFFLKLDRYPKAAKELTNYQDCTALFVPFDARPNVDLKRCMLAATRGIIVGNWVDRSESLADVVARTSSNCPAIESLFNHALAGWRTQAHLQQSTSTPRAFDRNGAIRSWDDAHRQKAEGYAAQARQWYGLRHTPDEIGALIDALPDISHRRALSHGDLHGENVRVIDGRAVLIDFVGVDDGPLVKDPAALETWLFLKTSADLGDWARVAGELYAPANVLATPQLREPTAALSGIWNVVRQIRLIGFSEQLTKGEYARAVAIQLLRHAMRPRDEKEQDHRRPLFIKLAEDIALELCKLHA